MSNAILYIQGQEVPLLNDISIPIVYSIEDIQSPDKTSSNYVNTLELPGTKELDLIFEAIFDPASDLQYFNPNLKTDCQLYVGGIDLFIGSVKLVKAINNIDTGVTKYICDFIGSKSDLFHNVGEKFLIGNDNPADDLDFSEYDHELNVTNVTNSWATSNMVSGVPTALVAGQGYRYGRIDYGYLGSGANGGSNYEYYVHHLRACLFLREYMVKMFTAAGKTWTSAFLDGAFFKTLSLPGTQPLLVPSGDLANRQAYVGTGGITLNTGLTYSGSVWNPAAATEVTLLLDDDSTSPFTDPGGIWSTGALEFSAPSDGVYTFDCLLTTSMTFSVTGSTTFPIPPTWNFDYTHKLMLQKFVGGVWTTVDTGPNPFGSVNFPSFTGSVSIVSSQSCLTGDKFRIRYWYSLFNLAVTGPGGPLSDGTVNSVVAYLTNPDETALKITIDKFIYEGDDVEVNQCIPRNFKQKDLLKAVINMFNLYIYEDKANPNNFLIEPRNDFYSTTKVEWTTKLDVGTPVENIIMGELDAKRYALLMAEDGDYYNKKYRDNWNEVFGKKEYSVENQFLTNTKEIEVMVSPTPMVGNMNSNNQYTILPHIYAFENNVIEPMKFNPRILIWSGLKTEAWNLKSVSGSNLQTQTPFIGTIDDPVTPTFDLGFGVPNEIYLETFPAYTWPANNLSSEFWDETIEQISNKNSRIVRMGVVLEDSDIKLFDFRKPVVIRGVTYVVNKIDGYDPMERKVTMVEFLKLT